MTRITEWLSLNDTSMPGHDQTLQKCAWKWNLFRKMICHNKWQHPPSRTNPGPFGQRNSKYIQSQIITLNLLRFFVRIWCTGPMSEHRQIRQCTPQKNSFYQYSLTVCQLVSLPIKHLLLGMFLWDFYKRRNLHVPFFLRNIFVLYLLLTSGAITGDHRHIVILEEFSSLWHLSIGSYCMRQTASWLKLRWKYEAL